MRHKGTAPHCVDRPLFLSEELPQLVPPSARYGYDAIVHVGKALLLRCRNGKEIQQALGTSLTDRQRATVQGRIADLREDLSKFQSAPRQSAQWPTQLDCTSSTV
ncbi:MAG: hypothetical protein GY792_11110 [Gammaproteobacteria bacterium]|nr:hypothetical protein [Gammaproteobacteria bacterium]